NYFIKSNLVYAGQVHSGIKKTDSLEQLFDSSETQIEFLRSKIDNLSIKRNSILKEINKIEESLSFHLKIRSKKNPKNSEINSSSLKFQISFLKEKKSCLKKKLYEINLEQIDLELQLRKKIYSLKK
ncbi:effector protein, partial [Candidatus Phytoplasma citri]